MICETKHCRNSAVKGRKVCHKCRKAAWRAKHPIKAAFNALRDSARSRNIEFGLTLEQFEAFCHKTKLITNKGKPDAITYSVDRIRNEFGYFDWNIQKMTLQDNIQKEADRKKVEGKTATRKRILNYDWRSGEGYFVTKPIEPDPEAPF